MKIFIIGDYKSQDLINQFKERLEAIDGVEVVLPTEEPSPENGHFETIKSCHGVFVTNEFRSDPIAKIDFLKSYQSYKEVFCEWTSGLRQISSVLKLGIY